MKYRKSPRKRRSPGKIIPASTGVSYNEVVQRYNEYVQMLEQLVATWGFPALHVKEQSDVRRQQQG